jgi:hypothetical protein
MSSEQTTLPGRSAQKPEYTVDLHGRGALILSYLAKTTSPVTIAGDVKGELTFYSDNGLQIFRLTKSDDVPLQTKLAPTAYSVTLRQGDLHGKAALTVKLGETKTLALKDFELERRTDLAAVAKGQRPMPRWGVAVGVNGGSFSRYGPMLEARVATRSVRVESSHWRLAIFAGGHRNALHYRHQEGEATAASVLLGINGSTLSSYGLDGQQWHLLVGGGTDYLWAHWQRNDDEPVREFDTMMPKVALGLGTSLIDDAGHTLVLAFRREWLFGKEKDSGDVLAFGANVITLSTEW